MRLSECPCHNIFTIDEDKDEPTFINEVGKFFLLDKLRKPKQKKTFFIFKAFLNDGKKAFLLSDGEGWLEESMSYEEIATIAQLYLYM